MPRTGPGIDSQRRRWEQPPARADAPPPEPQPATARRRLPSNVQRPVKTSATTRADNRGKDQESAAAPVRRIVFLSHANPEDNPAAAWYATQLTLLGYEVCCDQKNSHGGESDFWLKVQRTIENDAAKFAYKDGRT